MGSLERRRRTVIGGVVLIAVLSAFGLHDAKRTSGAEESGYRKIEIVAMQEIPVTVTPYPDFDLYHLSVVGKGEENGIHGADGADPEPTKDDRPSIVVSGSIAGDVEGSDEGEQGAEGADGFEWNDYEMGESESDDCTFNTDEYEYVYLGEWTATAYCPCEICCGEYSSGYTASGTLATEGRTIACNSLPFGTELMIDGVIYTVEDTGYSPYGDEWVDIFFSDHDSALAYGVRTIDVYLVN